MRNLEPRGEPIRYSCFVILLSVSYFNASTLPQFTDLHSQRRDRTSQDVREGNEPGELEGPTGCDVGRVATRGWNGAELVAGSLQFLDEVRAQSAPPKRLHHLHVDVAVRPVVMEQDSSFRGDRSIHFEEPLAATLPALQTGSNFFLRSFASKDGAIRGVSGGQFVVEDNLFRADVTTVRKDHDRGQHVIRLNFKEARATGREEALEEIEPA